MKLKNHLLQFKCLQSGDFFAPRGRVFSSARVTWDSFSYQFEQYKRGDDYLLIELQRLTMRGVSGLTELNVYHRLRHRLMIKLDLEHIPQGQMHVSFWTCKRDSDLLPPPPHSSANAVTTNNNWMNNNKGGIALNPCISLFPFPANHIVVLMRRKVESQYFSEIPSLACQ